MNIDTIKEFLVDYGFCSLTWLNYNLTNIPKEEAYSHLLCTAYDAIPCDHRNKYDLNEELDSGKTYEQYMENVVKDYMESV